jgi:hypothetical protein
MSIGGSSSEYDSLSDSPLSSDSSICSEGGSRSYSSLSIGLGIWLKPGTVLVERLLMKCPLVSLTSNEIVVVVV